MAAEVTGPRCARPGSSGTLELRTRSSRAKESIVHERRPSRRIVHQHHPHPVHRRGPAGQLRPPGHPHGHGAGGLLPVAALPSFRSRRSHLAQPGPLRAVRGARLHAPLLAAAPDRGQGGEQGLRDPGGPVGAVGGSEAVPPARQPLPGSSRVPLDFGGGDHHGPPGPGRRHQRGHGHRRKLDGRALQPARLRRPTSTPCAATAA